MQKITFLYLSKAPLKAIIPRFGMKMPLLFQLQIEAVEK
jgi:hypothetical protein